MADISVQPHFQNGDFGTLTVATLNVAGTQVTGANRMPKTAIVPLNGTTIKAATMGWTNPEAGDIIIDGLLVDTGSATGAIATAAGTLSVGTTTVSLTTGSQNLLDTVDLHSATGVFDNYTDKGTLGKSRQRLASGKFVTFSNQTGDLTGMLGNAYIQYFLI